MYHFHFRGATESTTVVTSVTGIDIHDEKGVVVSVVCNP
jgi:hypothetical protein